MYDHVKQHKWAKLKVGMVVSIAFIIVFLAVMFAGNIEKIFAPTVMIYAVVDDVKGLRDGSPVWFSGVEIGVVKSIEFSIHQKVKVKMSIASDTLKYLKKDSRANILTLGLLGDKYVEITPGSNEAESLKAGDEISGKTQIEFQDVVQTSEASIAKITDFINMLEEILVKMEKSEGTVARLITDPSVYDNLEEAIKALTTLINKIESGKGAIGRLLNEETIYTNLSSSVDDIKQFAKKLEGSEGTLNKLINDPALYDRFRKASESLDTFTQKLALSKGTVNKLIEDESLYENINAASEKLNSLLERIDRGEGLMGSLVRDEEFSKELKSTLRDLNALIKDIKENPHNYFKFSIF
ncbi:MAG TPA: MCE family protein [Nitrospirae bacterium]|nr:mce related protein [bacterium BMS3Abin06]HDH12645.1 MCE family protein [Nitrospirota bacterium]HDY99909.1 MCE family protein [Nitrospirota bacterium]